MKTTIALVGDYNPTAVVAHRAIPEALTLIAGELGRAVEGRWLATESLTSSSSLQLATADGIWCVPGSPYVSTEGALAAIRHARTRSVPFLGTCGGFQHALLEYAVNVWGMPAAQHAELNPEATDPVIEKLSCSLVDVSDELHLAPHSTLARVYGARQIVEEFRCNYGLNPSYASRLQSGDLKACAHDRNGEIRAVELAGHRFFVATLFQPERAALKGRVPPLVRAFVKAALKFAANRAMRDR